MNQGTALVASGVDPDVSAALAIYERIKPLKDALGVQSLTDGELQVFAYVARFTGLDPFTKQIYAIKRGGRVTHQTGIDGYRSVAERTKQYAGSDEAEFEACSCGQDDSPADHPKVARVTVHRLLEGGTVVDQVGVARWHELKPPHTKFENARDFQDSMWWKQPYGQLAKCAEANGLRKAFPRVLGGVYIADEMQGAQVVEGQAREVRPAAAAPTAKERIAARRASAEATAPAATAAPVEASAEDDLVDVAEGLFTEDPVPATSNIVASLRASADASALDGLATEAQQARLNALLLPLGKEAAIAGVAALWPDAVADGKLVISAAQANAVILAADSLGDGFAAAWTGLATGEAVAS